jgi:hypothetical protein
MKMKTNYRSERRPSAKSNDDPVIMSEDDPASSQHQGVSGLTQEPRLPTKVSFKGGSHLGNPKTNLLASLSNLGDEISFKGGSL